MTDPKVNTKLQKINATTIKSIPLSQLKRSPENVRTVDVDSKEDKALIESIKNDGLLQNLVVVKNKRNYLVTAGGRRLGALELLLKDKLITKDYFVPCNEVLSENGLSASLSENYFRADMHPADQFNAVFALKSKGMSVEEIAVHYSLAVPQVRKLLALAKVHKTIIEDFKKDKVSFDVVQAFTVCSVKSKQLEFYKSCDRITAHLVRSHFTNDTIDSSHSVVKCIGVDSYEKAGGAISNDLFAETVILHDISLVEKLATEKLSVELNKVEKLGFSWAKADLNNVYEHEFDNVLQPDYQNLPKHLVNEFDAIEKTKKQIEKDNDLAYDAIPEDEWELPEDIEKALDKRNDEVNKREEKTKKEAERYLLFTDEQKAVSGIVVCLDNEGKLKVLKGMMKKSDVTKQRKIEADKIKANVNKNGDDTDTQKTAEVIEAQGITQALREDLHRYDTQLFQLDMLQNPLIAFKAYAFEQCYTLLSNIPKYEWSSCFSNIINDKVYRSDEMIVSDAYPEIEKLISAIDRKWIKKDVVTSFEAFKKLTDKQIMTLLGQVASLSGTAHKESFHKTDNNVYGALLKDTGFKKYEYWKPSKDNYFKRLSLPLLHKLAVSALGKEWLKPHVNKSKKDLVESIDIAFKGKGVTNEKTLKQITEYLPESM